MYRFNEGRAICCVYKLYKGSKVVYVGQTTDLSSRLVAHKHKAFDMVGFIAVVKEHLHPVESALIAKYLPTLNRTRPSRFLLQGKELLSTIYTEDNEEFIDIGTPTKEKLSRMEEIVQFVPMEKELMKLTEVKLVSDPKKLLKLTPTSKLLYRYMLDRYQHFNRLEKKFFDNQEAMAEAIGVTSRTVLNIIKDFVEFGLVQKTATKTVGAAHSNSYVVLDIFDKGMFNTFGNGKLLNKYAPKSFDYVIRNRQ